jgi:hypothetical protein
VIALFFDLAGYVFVPVLTGAQPSLVEAALGATDPSGFLLAYHAAVVFLPPFVLALCGTVLVRARGFTGRWTDGLVLGGIVVSPLMTVLLTYMLTAVGVGVLIASAGDSPDLLVVPFATTFALLFGLPFALVGGLTVLGVEGFAAGAGYLCARRVWRLGGRDGTPADAETGSGTGSRTAPDPGPAREEP